MIMDGEGIVLEGGDMFLFYVSYCWLRVSKKFYMIFYVGRLT